MIPFPSTRLRGRRVRSVDPRPGAAVLLASGSLLLSVTLGPVAAAAAPKVLTLDEAVDQSRQAASAVLARSGDEACLRGKLTNALLRLSSSCKAAGEGGELCDLARSAAVVTPMTLRFMDDTSRRLLELSPP